MKEIKNKSQTKEKKYKKRNNFSISVIFLINNKLKDQFDSMDFLGVCVWERWKVKGRDSVLWAIYTTNGLKVERGTFFYDNGTIGGVWISFK